MDCTATRERLPFRLNGTLDEDEARDLGVHLEGCPGCREEWEETRRAAALLDTHPPSAAWVALAWGRPFEDLPRDLLERHLSGCRSCAEELALARTSRAAEAEVGAQATPPRGRAAWRWAGLAASVALAFVTGRSWEALRQDPALHAARDRASASARAEELRREVEALRSALPETPPPPGPRHLELVELLPNEALRGAAGEGASVVAGDAPLALSLVLDTPMDGAALRLVARDRDGAELWTADSLERQLGGDVIVLVPREPLGPGEIQLALEGRVGDVWRPLASYRLAIRAR